MSRLAMTLRAAAGGIRSCSQPSTVRRLTPQWSANCWVESPKQDRSDLMPGA